MLQRITLVCLVNVATPVEHSQFSYIQYNCTVKRTGSLGLTNKHLAKLYTASQYQPHMVPWKFWLVKLHQCDTKSKLFCSVEFSAD